MPTIVVNGKQREIEEGLSIEALLTQLDLDPRAVAVEHNRRIVERERYDEIVVEQGDRLEIVRFVQ
ncbi:MAG: sulfur carrier protein ThiS, partial [Thermoanaerobaculia bacterium]|nr:sulfur carrier protein ThiS [Thermoanaerobaculia bacterium]